MAKVNLTKDLRVELETLFNSCIVRPERQTKINQIAATIQRNRASYEAAAKASGAPWYFIAVVHNMESDMSFSRHLHNGDPLTARTVQVPAGRPKAGNPPFAWDVSAADALGIKSLSARTDWSLAGTIYQIEGYNGWGYRLFHPHVLSPYLWAGSNHYTSGKYVKDGLWSDTAVSQQNGAAVVLRRLAELEQISFADQPPPAATATPMVVTYSTRKSTNAEQVRAVEDLQRWLNTFPGVFVKIDGGPGDRTSEAYRKVTGKYLPGDPRGA